MKDLFYANLSNNDRRITRVNYDKKSSQQVWRTIINIIKT